MIWLASFSIPSGFLDGLWTSGSQEYTKTIIFQQKKTLLQ